MSEAPPRATGAAGLHFATTQWSLVLAAGARDNAESTVALERLCQAYWPALYAYVRRRVGLAEEAQDLTQAFFERLLEKNYLSQANPQRGRFRAFLITAFKHFLANEWESNRAQKRGGAKRTLSLDFAGQDSAWTEPAHEWTAERHYDWKWAITMLSRVMGQLQREMERQGKGRQFQCLKEFIAGPGDAGYAPAAAELQISEPAARMAASRLRSRYRELLRGEIAQTVSSSDEVDLEIEQLFLALSSQ